MLDFLFLFDNLLMFFTTFINKYGLEIKDTYEIYLNYTRTWTFVFDSLSILGSFFFTKIHHRLRYF